MRSDEREGKSGGFCWNIARSSLEHSQRGGCSKNHSKDVPQPLSFISLIPLCLSAVNRPPRVGREKKRGARATPPKVGGHVIPDSGAMFHASIRSHAGSLSSLFIPAGRLGTAPRRGRLKKGHRPMETAVAPVGKNPLSPLPGMIPDRTLKGLGAAEAYCA